MSLIVSKISPALQHIKDRTDRWDFFAGLLYIAQSNTTASGIVSVTWDIPSMSSASTTSATATLSNGTSPGVLYTGVNDTALSNVAVVDSASVDGTTTGYTLYGKQLVYYDGSALEAKFWAKQVVDGADSVWQLLWNNQNQDQTLLTPVAIKITAPATATTSSSS